MSKQEAIKMLEAMDNDTFDKFFISLPPRVRMSVKGGLVDWKDCLSDWVVKLL